MTTSPSVQIQTNTSGINFQPYVSAEVAAFVGNFERGPVNVPVYIRSIDQFKFLFGRGVSDHIQDWYQVYNFLQYGSGIWVVRTAGEFQYNSNTTDEPNITFSTNEEWLDIKDSLSVTGIRFFANTPGGWGNLLKVSIINKTDWDNNVQLNENNKAQDVFNFFEDDYVGIVIFRKDAVAETYYETVQNLEKINDESLYVKFLMEDGITSSELSYYNETNLNLTGGLSSLPGLFDFEESYDLLKGENYLIDIVIGNELEAGAAIAFAEEVDAIAFIGLPSVIVNVLMVNIGGDYSVFYDEETGLPIGVNNVDIPGKLSPEITESIEIYIGKLPRSTRAHFTMNVKSQLDIFTNKLKLINVAGDIAGLKAASSINSPWSPMAGLENGRIKNANKMHISLSPEEIKYFHNKGLNITNGNILMSQRTFVTERGGIRHVNTASLYNHLKREITNILNAFIFNEPNLQTRQNIATRVKRYLEDIKAGRGILDGRLHVYPGSNEREIIIEVSFRPSQLIEYINLRITNSGTEILTELIS